MREIKEQLEKLHKKIEGRIQDREDYFFIQADNWQDSPKADEHERKTEYLENAVNSITEAIEEINGFLD